MKPFSNIILGLGIVMMMTGVAGTGITFRDMRLERHLHDAVSVVRFSLAASAKNESRPFSLAKEGVYTLHVATTPIASSPRSEKSTSSLLFRGKVHYAIVDTNGRTRHSGSVDSGATMIVSVGTPVWSALDTLYIPLNAGERFRLHADVSGADSSFRSTSSQIILMPPGVEEIAGSVRSGAYILAGMGLLIIGGFCLTFFGGHLRRKLSSEPGV